MRLVNKTVIITGAGSGFGEGIARRFADEGARIIVNDINAEAGERVVEAITAAGGSARFQAADVAVDEDVKELVGAAVEAFGGLDIMVNNAGITHLNRPMLEVEEDEFDRIFAVNVKAIYLAARHALPVFRGRGGGVFLNTASTAGIRPRPGLTWYNGSKGAAIVLTKSMAVELAPENIRVNALCPVIGATGLLTSFMGGDDTPDLRAKFEATIPMGRISTPRDIANAALYLCSDEADFITGVCLEVDGGRCI